MANTLLCDIVTPDSMLFAGEGVLIGAPAADGDIGLMYQCSPLMSTLRRGLVRIKGANDESISFAINGGYLEVDGEKVIVLATRAVEVTKIVKDEAEAAVSEIESRLGEMEEGNPARAFCVEEISWQKYLLTQAK